LIISIALSELLFIFISIYDERKIREFLKFMTEKQTREFSVDQTQNYIASEELSSNQRAMIMKKKK
jgi:hypothetical protein